MTAFISEGIVKIFCINLNVQFQTCDFQDSRHDEDKQL